MLRSPIYWQSFFLALTLQNEPLSQQQRKQQQHREKMFIYRMYGVALVHILKNVCKIYKYVQYCGTWPFFYQTI